MISIDHFQPELCSCARIQPRRRFKPDRVGGSVVRRRESRPRARVAPIIIAILIELIMDSAASSNEEREREREREGEGAATFIIYSLLSNGIRRSFGGFE